MELFDSQTFVPSGKVKEVRLPLGINISWYAISSFLPVIRYSLIKKLKETKSNRIAEMRKA